MLSEHFELFVKERIYLKRALLGRLLIFPGSHGLWRSFKVGCIVMPYLPSARLLQWLR